MIIKITKNFLRIFLLKFFVYFNCSSNKPDYVIEIKNGGSFIGALIFDYTTNPMGIVPSETMPVSVTNVFNITATNPNVTITAYVNMTVTWSYLRTYQHQEGTSHIGVNESLSMPMYLQNTNGMISIVLD